MKGFSEMNNDELRQMRHDTLMEILNPLSKFFFVHDSEMLLMSHGGLTSCIGSKRGYKALSSFLKVCRAGLTDGSARTQGCHVSQADIS